MVVSTPPSLRPFAGGSSGRRDPRPIQCCVHATRPQASMSIFVQVCRDSFVAEPPSVVLVTGVRGSNRGPTH